MRTVLIVAQSLDGFITRHDTPGVDWVSAADQAWFRSCLPEFDAQVMGRVTFEAVRDTLLPRLPDTVFRAVMTSRPELLEVHSLPGNLEFTAEEPSVILDRFHTANRKSCAILGGAGVHDAFLAYGLVDELWVTIEPRIFGEGTPLVRMRHDIQLELIDHRILADSQSMLVRYRVTP